MLSRIIAVDETWAGAYEPELKRPSVKWRHSYAPRKRKVRQSLLTNEADNQFGLRCQRCCVSSRSIGSDCEYTVLQVIYALPSTLCS